MGMFNLKGFDNIHEATVCNEVLDSLIEWLDWGLLNKRNYFNVSLGEVDHNGQDLSRLKLSNDKRFISGQAWEGIKPNWVWQSLNVVDPPLVPTGVYVDGDYYSNNVTGTYAHYIDFFNGRVVFNSPINPSSTVQVEYSYKWISVLYSSSFFNGIKVVESEDSELLSPELVNHLPAIAIEVIGKPRQRGYQLGGGQFLEYIVLFHCLASNDIFRDRLMDITSFQNDTTIFTFNTNQISLNGDLPIDHRGAPKVNAKNYEELVRAYPRYKVRLNSVSTSIMELKSSSYFGGTVKLTAEVIKTNI